MKQECEVEAGDLKPGARYEYCRGCNLTCSEHGKHCNHVLMTGTLEYQMGKVREALLNLWGEIKKYFL